MPSLSCSSAIRAVSENHILSLKVTHNLVHGSSTEKVHKIRGRFAKELDILWLSDIVVVLTASLDEREASASKVLQSGLLSHIHQCLRVNANQLGLNNISNPYIDEEDGRTKLVLTPSRPLPPTLRPHIVLTSLEMSFLWKTINGCQGFDNPYDVLTADSGPLSPKMYLPTEALLGRVMEQFLTHHLVGRYPLIFGPWSMGLDLETNYFSPIARSIIDIFSRSQNAHLRSKYSRLLKIARRHLSSVFQVSSAALALHLEENASGGAPVGNDNEASTARLSDEDILCQVLEQLYRIGVPQRRPKLTAHRTYLFSEGDDHDLVDSPDFNAGTDVVLSPDERVADVSVAMAHASYICDQPFAKPTVKCSDFVTRYLPEDDNAAFSIYPEHTYKDTSLTHGSALDTNFATPQSSSLASTGQDYHHSVATLYLQTPPLSTDSEYRHAWCIDPEPVTSPRTVDSHGSGCALQDNCLFELSLDPSSANGADVPPQNFTPLILDDNPRDPSEDLELWNTFPRDDSAKMIEEDIDLMLFELDDGSADSSEVDLFLELVGDCTASSFCSPTHDLYAEDIMRS